MPARSPALPALREPRAQLGLLVLISALVGVMLGMDRALMAGLRAPLLGLGVNASAVGFIAAFGLSTALGATAAGLGADRWGWRRVLVAGWVLAAPAPFLFRVASSWGGFHAANVLYGLSLRLLGSATAVGVIELAGPARRGLAVGLHEAAGTVAMALSAHFIRVMVADQQLRHSGRLALGLGCVLIGGVLSATLLREARPVAAPAPTAAAHGRHPDLAGLSHAGLIYQLNDGLAWGLVALAYRSDGIDRATNVALLAVYPAIAWVGQLLGGALSDRVGRRPLIVGGLAAQALALVG